MKINLKQTLAALLLVSAIVAVPLSLNGEASKGSRIILTKDNSVSLNGEIDSDSVSEAVKKLQQLDKIKTDKPIYLFIYSPGGSIQDGLELIEAANGLNRPVQTITLFGASMAFQTAQQLGKRYVLKNGMMMSHRASGQFEGSFGGSVPSQLDSRYSFWLQRIKEMDQKTVERTGGKYTLDSYQKLYRDEAWFTGQQAVEQGFADEIVNVQCGKGLDGVKTKHASFMGIDIAYDLSDCPLLTQPSNIRAGSSDAKSTSAEIKYVEIVKAKFVEAMDFTKNYK